jgi:hypothetical protein
MNLHKELQKIIDESSPRHVSQIVKRNDDVFSYVNRAFGDTISEKIYNTLHPDEFRCPEGHVRKFKSLKDGYGFCGPAGKCQCARNHVSEKVSNTVGSFSKSKKRNIQQKREKTNLLKYGVTNTGQTEHAINRHREFYENENNVEAVVSKVESTKLSVYGDPYYNNKEQIRKTLQEKFSVDYVIEKYDNKSYGILHDKEKLSTLYEKHGIPELVDILGVHVQTIYKYLNKHGIRDRFESEEEKEVRSYIAGLGIDNIVSNSRSILPSGKELDIYLPDYNIAIEYNGVYWHHEDVSHIDKYYHYDKFKECEANGIHLITIFSTEWKNKKDIVKKILKYRLGIKTKSVYARNTKIKEVSTKDAKQFLDQYHLQGYTPSAIRLGLYLEDELLALMTFAKNRSGIGKSRDNVYELVRFVTSVSVVGGASKLLKHAIETHRPESIISYSDNEWSVGNLYKVLGFVLEKEHKPSYWYVKPREERRYHRYNYAKYKLVERGFDPTKTAGQIMKENGFLKIWDCGKRTWRYDINPKK